MANLTFDFLHNYVTGERRASDPADAYQYDEGRVLEAVVPVAVASCEIQYWIRGMEKADAYTPTSITQNTDNTYTILGNIPNSYFETNGDLRVYIVVTDGDASITTYEGYIHIKERQMPEDYVDDDPDNEAVRVIAEARAAAATATEKAGEAAASAEQAQEILDSIPEDYSQLSEDVSDLKDDFHEYHSELGAGYADQLVSSIENTDQTPYNFRKVPYDATLEQVEGIVGCDVVVNQLVQNGNFADASGWNGRFATVSVADGVATMTPESDGAQRGLFITSNGTTNANHKYFLHVFAKPAVDCRLDMSINGANGASPKYVSMTANVWNDCGVIWTTASDYSSRMFYMLIVESLTTSQNVQYKTASICDLTAMFGTQIADYAYSLEQTTAGAGVAWLKQHFSKIFNRGYVPYNAGTMVHVSGLSAKKTVGFNLFDESLDGDVTGNYRYIHIPIEETNQLYMGLKEKDSSISLTGVYFGFFKDPANAALGNNWVVTNGFVSGNHNNVSTAGETGELCGYVVVYPSTKATFDKIKSKYNICINLSDPTRNGEYEPYEEHTYPLDSSIDLHGILKLDSNNQLYADGDVYKADGTVTRNYTKRAYQSGDESLANAITDGTNTVVKLSTPTTEQAEPYNPNQICDPNGTEEYISDTVAPVGHVTKYPLDIAGRLDNILTMPTANGTYTLRATVADGKVTYNWVSE